MQSLPFVTEAALLSMLTYSGIPAVSLFYSQPAVPNAQLTRQIGRNINNTSHVIPGGSPWFYLKDPEETLLQ